MRILLSCLLFSACGGSSQSEVLVEVGRSSAVAPTVDRSIAHIDVAGLKALYDAGETPQLVDVRNVEEQLTGMVPGAVSMPLHEFSPAMPPISTTDPKKPIYFICESGSRSLKAAEMTSQAGFVAVNVDGGTSAWRLAGYPISK